MADLLEAFRFANELAEAGGFSPEDIALLQGIAARNPKVKVIVPTPGTEPMLNGNCTVDTISDMIADIPEGQPIPTKREIIINHGGNPKSSRDQAKVAKLLPDVPGIQMIPGKKSQMVRRLTDQRTLDKK